MDKSLFKYIMLISIVLLGLVLRLNDLGKESFWADEIYSLSTSQMPFTSLIEHTAKFDNHPPLFYSFLHFWIKIVDISEKNTRLLSVLFGILTLFMTYFVGKLLYNDKVGMIATLLTSLSVFHIRYSQETRMYTLLTLLTLLSMFFLIKILQSEKKMFVWGYVVSSLLLMYTHYSGCFIIIMQNVYIFLLLIFKRNPSHLRVSGWILIQILLGILFVPWVIASVTQFTVVYGAPYPPLSVHLLKANIYEFCSSKYGAVIFFLVLLGGFCSLLKQQGVALVKSSDILKSNTFFVVLWVVLPLSMFILISIFITPIYISRITIPESLAFYLLIAKILGDMKKKYVFTVLLFMIVVVMFLSDYRYHSIHRVQWKELTNYVQDNKKQGDVLLYGWSGLKPILDFYVKDNNIPRELISDSIPLNKSVRYWIILPYGDVQNETLIRNILGDSYRSDLKIFGDDDSSKVKLCLFESM